MCEIVSTLCKRCLTPPHWRPRWRWWSPSWSTPWSPWSQCPSSSAAIHSGLVAFLWLFSTVYSKNVSPNSDHQPAAILICLTHTNVTKNFKTVVWKLSLWLWVIETIIITSVTSRENDTTRSRGFVEPNVTRSRWTDQHTLLQHDLLGLHLLDGALERCLWLHARLGRQTFNNFSKFLKIWTFEILKIFSI